MEGITVEYWSKKKLRQILADVSDATIFRWVRSGRLPKPRQIGPGRVAFLRHEVEAALLAFPVAECKPVAPSAVRRGRIPRITKAEGDRS